MLFSLRAFTHFVAKLWKGSFDSIQLTIVGFIVCAESKIHLNRFSTMNVSIFKLIYLKPIKSLQYYFHWYNNHSHTQHWIPCWTFSSRTSTPSNCIPADSCETTYAIANKIRFHNCYPYLVQTNTAEGLLESFKPST